MIKTILNGCIGFCPRKPCLFIVQLSLNQEIQFFWPNLLCWHPLPQGTRQIGSASNTLQFVKISKRIKSPSVANIVTGMLRLHSQ